MNKNAWENGRGTQFKPEDELAYSLSKKVIGVRLYKHVDKIVRSLPGKQTLMRRWIMEGLERDFPTLMTEARSGSESTLLNDKNGEN